MSGYSFAFFRWNFWCQQNGFTFHGSDWRNPHTRWAWVRQNPLPEELRRHDRLC